MSSHYDFVKLPNGKLKKVYSLDDIKSIQEEWGEYCENNWLNSSPSQTSIYDPESKVKFLLEGLANSILRPNMAGMITEYKQKKIDMYEIPISTFDGTLGNVLCSQEGKKELAWVHNEASFAKPKKTKNRMMTRSQKITQLKQQGITQFSFENVDTENRFTYQNRVFRIDESVIAYAPKVTKEGDLLYDMDRILCGIAENGNAVFFDMNIEPIPAEKIFLETR